MTSSLAALILSLGTRTTLSAMTRETGVASIAHFGSVLYPEVYPGIDLAFHSAGRDFEYDFILQPGRTPQVITIDFVGPTHLTMDSEGNLVLATPGGNVSQKKPVAYQMKQNRRYRC